MYEILEDIPISVTPDIPNWAENFALAVFDPVRKIDVFCHIGRWRKDLALWRECVLIALPDGSTVYHRAIGNALASSSGPGGPNFSMEVITNFRELRWRFLGGAPRVPAAVARENLPQDGPLERLDFDLTFRSDLPIWDIAQMGEKTDPIVRGHTEQIGLLKGGIRVGQEYYEFEGIGNRDHTRGPRLQKDEPRSHTWLHGSFENGISFLGYEVLQGEDQPPAMSEGAVYDGGRLYPATWTQDLHLPRNGLHMLERPFSIFVKCEGRELKIDVQNFHTTNFIQYTAPWDLYVGRRQIDADVNRCVPQQSARMVLDGSIEGYGHVERSIPGPIIFDPV